MNEIMYAYGKFVELDTNQIKFCEAMMDKNYEVIDELVEIIDRSTFELIQEYSYQLIDRDTNDYTIKKYCDKIIDPIEKYYFKARYIGHCDYTFCAYARANPDIDSVLRFLLHNFRHFSSVAQTLIDDGYRFGITQTCNVNIKQDMYNITLYRGSKSNFAKYNILTKIILQLYDHMDYFEVGKGYILHCVARHNVTRDGALTKHGDTLTKDEFALLIEHYRNNNDTDNLLFLYAMQNNIKQFEHIIQHCDINNDTLDKILLMITKDKIRYASIYNLLMDHFVRTKNLYFVESVLVAGNYHLVDELFDIFDPTIVAIILIHYYVANYDSQAFTIAKILIKYYAYNIFDNKLFYAMVYKIKEPIVESMHPCYSDFLFILKTYQFKKIDHYLLFLAKDATIFTSVTDYLKVSQSYNKFGQLLRYSLTMQHLRPIIDTIIQCTDLNLINEDCIIKTLIEFVYEIEVLDMVRQLEAKKIIQFLVNSAIATHKCTCETIAAVLPKKHPVNINAISLSIPCFRPELLDIPELQPFIEIGEDALSKISSTALFYFHKTFDPSMFDELVKRLSADQLHDALLDYLISVNTGTYASHKEFVQRLFASLKNASGDEFEYFVNQQLFDLLLENKNFEEIVEIAKHEHEHEHEHAHEDSSKIHYGELFNKYNIPWIREGLFIEILKAQPTYFYDSEFCAKILKRCVALNYCKSVAYLLDNHGATVKMQHIIYFTRFARCGKLKYIKRIMDKMREQTIIDWKVDFGAVLRGYDWTECDRLDSFLFFIKILKH